MNVAKLGPRDICSDHRSVSTLYGAALPSQRQEETYRVYE